MKTKKIVSLLLAIIMVVGLLPMSALADGIGDLIATKHGIGEYTDMDSLPQKSYQYTVVGSDGSNKNIIALGSDAKTGNNLKLIFPAGEIYYKEIDNPGNHPTNGTVLMVADDYAVSSLDCHKTVYAPVVYDDYRGNHIKGEKTDAEYTWSRGGDGLMITSVNGKGNFNIWASFGFGWKYGIEFKNGASNHWWINNDGSFRVLKDYSMNFFLVCDKNGTSIAHRADGVASNNAGSTFHLYEKVAVKENGYIVETTSLDALIKEAEAKREFEKSYTDQSWARYQEALTKAKNTSAANKDGNKNVVVYGEAEAEKKLTEINAAEIALRNALSTLETEIGVGDCVMPKITWHRSLGDGDNEVEERVKNLYTLSDDASKNFPIVWKWDSVKDIKASKSQAWYNLNGMSVGTWQDTDKNNWNTSSIRRFSGTFVWPYGYDFNDKAEILSANDSPLAEGKTDPSKSKYADIYKYIDNHKNDAPGTSGREMYERYKNSRVLAVNDNVYVFISKANEQPSQWTSEQATQRMIFWTGTDGKGLWSDNKLSGADFGRKEPASFLGKSAIPSFHKSYPNMEDTAAERNQNVNKGNVHYWEKNHDLNNKTQHSDGWYSLVDTSNVMTTLKNTYPGETEQSLGGQLMRIEVFAFDNDGAGGMDELKLRICSPNADDVKVQVNYFINIPGKDGQSAQRIQMEGMSTIFYATEGANILLPNGTRPNELNYAKAEAERKIPTGSVSNGRQVNKDFVAHKNQNNIIEVEYDGELAELKSFAYDFATKNEFIYKDPSTTEITSVTVDKIQGATATFDNKTHEIKISYTPSKANEHAQLGTLVITRKGQNVPNEYPICIIPASNVLYEENFFVPENTSTKANWKLEGEADPVTVKDNDSVFGYTNAYAQNRGQNGAYVATLSAEGAQKRSDNLNFTFSGKGFDLIGACGPTTGTVYVSVRDTNGNYVKGYMVNTAFKDQKIYQVPIVHCMDLTDGTYNVMIRAAYVDYNQKSTRMTYSMRKAVGTNNNAAYNTLVEMGLTEDEIAKTEFINVEDTLPSRVFARRSAPAAATAAPNTMTVELGACRVYRDTKAAQSFYPAEECDITYTNILDATEGNFTAYIEGKTEGNFDLSNYVKNGSPSGEVYLNPNKAIAIKLANGVSDTQISVRAVSANTVMGVNTLGDRIVNHNTEMYYKVSANDQGLIVISNRGTEPLAIVNVKSAIQSLNDADMQNAVAIVTRMMAAPINPDPVEPEKPSAGIFSPAKFDIELNVVKAFFNQYATLKVKTSDDVAYITVNGVRVDQNNAVLHKWGIHDFKRFTLKKTFKKGENFNFEVIAYDKNGNSTYPIVK